MNLKASLALAVLVVACTDTDAATVRPDKVCLNVREIQRTETPNDRTIIFHMRDGKVWRNTLRSVCPMLSISPYSQVLHTEQVCANQQFIRVAQSGYTCVLGDFTPVQSNEKTTPNRPP